MTVPKGAYMSSEYQGTYEKGYADGVWARTLNKRPSSFQMVGIVNYCHGFRAAYFHRAALAESVPIDQAPPGRYRIAS